MRLTAVLLAGFVAFAGALPPTPLAAEEPSLRPAPRYALPAIDRFGDLGPTLPPTTSAQPERGTVMTQPIRLPAPRSEHVVTRADLDRAGVLVAAYRAAAAAAPASCNLPVALLAAIGQIESGSAGGRQIGADHVVRPGIYGPLLDGGPFAVIRDTDHGALDGNSTWDRAVGPMQFIPSTWARSGVDGDGDGRADPQNVYDAAFSAAGYLCNHGRDLSRPSDLRAAIYAYNQSDAYVLAVLEWMSYFDGKGLEAVSAVGFRVGSGGRASQLPAVQSTATTLSPTASATTPPTAAGATPAPVTTTPSSTTTATAAPTATGSASAPTTTTTTSPTSAPTTATTTASPTSTQTPGTSTTTPACPSPTTTVTVTPSPTTTVTVTPSPTTTTATPTPTTTTSPTTATPTTSTPTCSGTATVTATPTATTTTTATEGPTGH